MGSLDGRVAVITGAGSGIGREHALYFAREGAAVVVNDTGAAADGSGGDSAVAESVAQAIRAAGGRAVASTDSVTDPDGAERMTATAVEAFGGLDAVVANAGILRNAPLVDMGDDDFAAVLAVHLTGTFTVLRAAARYWSTQPYRSDRRAVTTSSGGGTFNPLPTQANYAAAKAGVAALTTVAALELRAYGVRVNAVAPSAHRTRLTRNIPGVAAPAPGAEEGRDPYAPDKSSPLAAHLCSADCAVTGQLFRVWDRTVQIGRGWTPAREVSSHRPWTPDSVAAALAGSADAFTDPVQTLLGALDLLDAPETARAALLRMLDDPASLRAAAAALV